MTREEYLQLRKGNARVYARKLVGPGVLFFVSLFVMPLAQDHMKQLSRESVNEFVLLCLPLATFFISLGWMCVLGFRDDKINAVHCSACGKDNKNAKAFLWLTASGKCVYCGEKILLDSPAMAMNEKTLISRTQFKEYLKDTEVKLLKVSLAICGPLGLGLVLLALDDPHFTSLENVPTAVGLLIGVLLLTYIGFFAWLESHIKKKSNAKCTHCGVFPNYTKKIILATGGCASCGHRMFEN